MFMNEPPQHIKDARANGRSLDRYPGAVIVCAGESDRVAAAAETDAAHSEMKAPCSLSGSDSPKNGKRPSPSGLILTLPC
jgi:hypothetical protein